MAVRLRDARPGDEMAVAEVHVRSWQEGYRGLMPDEFLDAQRPEDRVGRYEFGASGEGAPLTVLAVEAREEGEILHGFVTIRPSRDDDAPGLGEVHALYVDPDRYQRGVGRMLMVEARARLREQGFTDALLWVLDGNDRAASFYEREGWEPDGSRRFEDPYDIPSHVSRFRRAL